MGLLAIAAGGALGAVLRYLQWIDALVPVLDAMIEDGLVTIENVQILRYRPGR